MVDFTFTGPINRNAKEAMSVYTSCMYILEMLLERGFNVSVAPGADSELAELSYLQELPYHPTRWLGFLTPQGVNSFTPNHTGGFVYTYSETTLLGTDVVPGFNRAGHIFSLSTFGKFAMLGAGVETPITVQPLGIDTTLYKPLLRKRVTDHPLVFLAKGHILRKNLDMAVRAYLEVFSEEEDCLLYVHNYRPQDVECVETLEQLCERRRDIKLINCILPIQENVKLYQEADYLIFPTSGEGFGLPPLEAMACGCTPIVTGFGAMLDFVSPQNSLIIRIKDFGLLSIKQDPTLCGVDGFLAVPDEVHLCELLDRTRTMDRRPLVDEALKVSALYDWKVCLSPLIEVIRSKWGI